MVEVIPVETDDDDDDDDEEQLPENDIGNDCEKTNGCLASNEANNDNDNGGPIDGIKIECVSIELKSYKVILCTFQALFNSLHRKIMNVLWIILMGLLRKTMMMTKAQIGHLEANRKRLHPKAVQK